MLKVGRICQSLENYAASGLPRFARKPSFGTKINDELPVMLCVRKRQPTDLPAESNVASQYFANIVPKVLECHATLSSESVEEFTRRLP